MRRAGTVHSTVPLSIQYVTVTHHTIIRFHCTYKTYVKVPTNRTKSAETLSEYGIHVGSSAQAIAHLPMLCSLVSEALVGGGDAWGGGGLATMGGVRCATG